MPDGEAPPVWWRYWNIFDKGRRRGQVDPMEAVRRRISRRLLEEGPELPPPPEAFREFTVEGQGYSREFPAISPEKLTETQRQQRLQAFAQAQAQAKAKAFMTGPEAKASIRHLQNIGALPTPPAAPSLLERAKQGFQLRPSLETLKAVGTFGRALVPEQLGGTMQPFTPEQLRQMAPWEQVLMGSLGVPLTGVFPSLQQARAAFTPGAALPIRRTIGTALTKVPLPGAGEAALKVSGIPQVKGAAGIQPKVGEVLQHPQLGKVTVTDISDPALLGIRTESGGIAKVGRETFGVPPAAAPPAAAPGAAVTPRTRPRVTRPAGPVTEPGPPAAGQVEGIRQPQIQPAEAITQQPAREIPKVTPPSEAVTPPIEPSAAPPPVQPPGGRPPTATGGPAFPEIPGGPIQSLEQANESLVAFGRYLVSNETEAAWKMTQSLRSQALAQRAEALQLRAAQLAAEGKTAEAAMRQAIGETMAGELPRAVATLTEEMAQQMRDALFSKLYHVLKDEPFEMMSTADALRNALLGKPIPRVPGTTGQSAYTRLQRVFADNPEIIESLGRQRPLKDIIDEAVLAGSKAPQEMRWLKYPPNVPFGQARFQGQAWSDMLKGMPDLPPDTRSALQRQLDLQSFETELAMRGKPPASAPLPGFEPQVEEVARIMPLLSAEDRNWLVFTLKESGLLATDIGGFLRANVASFDFSWWRQQALLISGHQREFWHANVESFLSIFSQKAADDAWRAIQTDPLFAIYDKMNLDFLRPLKLPPGAARVRGVEEFGYLQSARLIPRLTEKIPWVRISQRTFVTGINGMNWRIFKDHYRRMLKVNEKIASGQKVLKPGRGFSVEQEMRNFGRMLEDFTGRAQLGPASAIAPALNNTFFAIRLNLGRLLTPRHLFAGSPHVRREAWRTLISGVGSIAGTLLLGEKLGFWEVEGDLRSPDTWKARIGNIRIDPWGGYQQFVRFAAQIVTRTGISATTGQEYKTDLYRAGARFFRGKQAPLASIVGDFTTGKTFLGEDIDIKNWRQWVERIAPFAIMDIADAFSEEGARGGLISILPSLVGFSVQAYPGETSGINISDALRQRRQQEATEGAVPSRMRELLGVGPR